MIRTRQKVAVYTILIVYAVITLVPVVYLIAASIKEGEDLDRYTFFPPPGKMTTINYARLFGSQRFGLNDIRDPAGFCRALLKDGPIRQPTDRPSPARRIWMRLTQSQRELIRQIPEITAPKKSAELIQAKAEYDRGKTEAAQASYLKLKAKYDREFAAYERTWREHREKLRALLDALLARRDLYTPDDFAEQRLGWEVRKLIKLGARDPAALSGGEIARRNRLLLEASFSDSIAQNQVRVPFLRYVINSLFVASTVVLIQVFFSSLGGFALAKYEFKGKTVLTLIMLVTMMIPMPVLLAPLYEQIYHLGLMDSHAGLIVPSAVSVFGLFLFRQSMLGLPDSLLEAARIDGCSEFGVYWRVAIPLTRPMIGAFTLIAFMGNWNSFLWPQIILHTKENFTLPIGLSQLSGTQEEILGPLMAGTLLAILPVMLLFLLFQREFISGLTKGAVKG